MTDGARGGSKKKKPAAARPAPPKVSKPARVESHTEAEHEAEEDSEEVSSVVSRAEDLVDRMVERSAHYTGLVARSMMRFAARLREEAEDVWAEAQEVRRQHPPEATP